MTQFLSLEVKNIKDIQRRLAQLPKNVDKRVTVSATRAGANVIKKQAIENVPVRTDGKLKKVSKSKQDGLRFPGYLKKNISIRRAAKRLAYGVIFKILPIRFAFYGAFLERGSKHQSPTKWLEPAYISKANAAIRKIGERFLIGLDRETAKLNKEK